MRSDTALTTHSRHCDAQRSNPACRARSWIASSLRSRNDVDAPIALEDIRCSPRPRISSTTPPRVTAGDSRWQGQTSDDYWAFVGPFGGATAATILRALIDHPQRAGDPLALTVNYCAPIAQGAFDLDVRLVKANRSSQHWCVEMTQGGGEVATLATAVFAERRPSWSPPAGAAFRGATPFEQTLPYPKPRHVLGQAI